ncbi:P27 family predicted phage terminase small subunit [Haloactinopolyspora alba]|uniref:P27 family predicted phage terminase small subunit n=1 Tax=Haloactinopolyspora alba TaxID=648780 RepID=A0A2P8DHI2_9ACTN|nr:phage terminase small subunit P27 family [Haloactinopolyspora alba]PSK96687.1 P27 family predicted phage terminase small subunit [Haloactinopolyspora alba]
MAKTGPKPHPPLQVVREGNPGKRPVREGAKAPPVGVDDLAEPDWLEWFPKGRRPSRPRKPPKSAGGDEHIAYQMKLRDWKIGVNAVDGANRCRQHASDEWRRVVPVLARAAGLGNVDMAVVVDYCVTVARLIECERRLSVEGLIVMGQRGECRNPLTTVATQYRTQLKAYIGELGLSPSSRGRIEPPGDDDDDGDDGFD